MAAATYGKCSTYKVTPNAEKTFYALYLTEEIVREALSKAGFNLERFVLNIVGQTESIPFECYCYVARKT